MFGSTRHQTRVGAVALAAAAATAVLSACGGDGGSESADGTVKVAATTSVAADIVREVAGDGVEVVQIVPEGSNPHSYAPSAREQAELTDADLLVLFDPALESALPIDAAARSFAIADHVSFQPPPEVAEEHEDEEHGGEEHEDEEHADEEHGHEHEGGDPHVWLDPIAVEGALPALAGELAEIDPAGAEGYARRAEAYGTELEELDAELASMVDRIPAENRKLVTSHDLLGWYANRYGFEVVGAPFGVAPEAEAGAETVQELIEDIESEGVPAVFAQQGDDPEVLRTIAGEAGVEVIDDLLVESFGEQAASYPAMMRFTTERIVAGLGG